MIWTRNSLEIFGLTKTEAVVLEVLDTAKSVQNIAKDSKISRTGINHTLKKLYNKGLITYTRHGKRKSYVAMTPSQLSHKLQIAVDELNISGGTKKSARVKISKESEFTIYTGIKEIIPAHERIASLNKDQRLRAIQPNKSWMNLHKKLNPKQLIRFNEAIRDNKIIVDAVVQSNAYALYGEFFKHDPKTLKSIAESFTDRMADYTSISEKFFDYNAEIWIYKETVFIINWEEEVAIEITNTDIMHFMKDMYEIVKSKGSKIDHNQIMREILGENDGSVSSVDI